MSVQKTMRHAWDRVGPGCVDIFLSLGLEKVEATNNHPEWPEMAYENASAMAKHLRPVEHRLSYESLPTSAGPSLDCVREGGDLQTGVKLCHKGPSKEVSDASAATQCSDAACTHCAVTSYYGHATRVAACADMVRSASRRLHREYKFFVYHRPDLLLYGIPPIGKWDFKSRVTGERADLSRTAFFCAPLPHHPPSDYFGVFRFEHIHLVAQLARRTMACQPRAVNVRAHRHWCADRGWPAWHTAECLLHAIFAKDGVRIESLTDEYWPSMQRSCRILRGKWRTNSQTKRRVEVQGRRPAIVNASNRII